MGYDRGDSFPTNFEPNGIPFGSENRKKNCHLDHIPFNVQGNGNIVFSARDRSARGGGSAPYTPGILIPVCVYNYIYIYIYVYIFLFKCIYLYINTCTYIA